VAVAAGLMWLGFGLTGLVPGRRPDPVTRWALAFPAVVLLALAMMVVHLVTGGALFQSATAVRAGTGLVAGALGLRWLVARARRGPRAPAGCRDPFLAAACSLLVAAVWGYPVFRMLPLAAGGDAGLHAGWTEQLLNGESTPSGPLTGDIPNYYPWLHHALSALTTHLTPGGHAYVGATAVHLLQVLGTAAALFGIGRLFAGRWCGAATALLAAATGGFGFFVARRLDLVVDPRAENGAAATRYLGDLLLVRSYNPSFANLAPAYPRDVALALLVGALFALARAVNSDRRLDYVVSGCLLGLVGLTQLDPFLVGLLAGVALAVTAPSGRRLGTGVAIFLPALAFFSLWAVPIAISYVQLGGFVNTTATTPVVLPAWAIVTGWGIVGPLAIVGAVSAARSLSHPVVRVIGAALVAGAVALGASALVSVAGGEGFETLGRQHRYWPLFGLPLALLAGLGLHWLVTRLRERSQVGARAAAVCALGLALPSPLIASLALPSKIHISPSLARALEGDENERLKALSEYGAGACSVAVPGARSAFSFTGFRFLLYRWDQRPENAARIRWAEIYDRIVPQAQRVQDNELLLSGSATPEQFRTIVRRYALDAVIVPEQSAQAEAFRGLPGRRVTSTGQQYVLYSVDRC
jgi:hypothetical protein